jgi:hypothetical protein
MAICIEVCKYLLGFDQISDSIPPTQREPDEATNFYQNIEPTALPTDGTDEPTIKPLQEPIHEPTNGPTTDEHPNNHEVVPDQVNTTRSGRTIRPPTRYQDYVVYEHLYVITIRRIT